MRETLTNAHNNVKSIVNGSSVADDLLGCETQINDVLSSFNVGLDLFLKFTLLYAVTRFSCPLHSPLAFHRPKQQNST